MDSATNLSYSLVFGLKSLKAKHPQIEQLKTLTTSSFKKLWSNHGPSPSLATAATLELMQF
jgi:hypothetical protein